ncbi:MAG TPA: heavy metal-binding domain-containing protein [Solirubrobacteraceae bacterium]|jgi:uncharacterized protein YbjQ (UPF0145 family)|nr:heavy metal-binding domain-containing protein [Solirubrobacteraceae bacterium]
MSPREPTQPDPSDEEEREQEESQARVEAGGIPLAAERRLRELGEGAGAFTSDLSVGSFALCHELGLTPLAQVMGSSIYQVGGYAGVLPGAYAGGYIYELDALSGAWNEARDRAFRRMAIEAGELGADAVVGVTMRKGERDFTEGAIECVVVGTAIRADGRARGSAEAGRASGRAVLTELSVPDYAKLRRAGIETLGVVAWTSIFFVQSWTSASLGRALGLMPNQELAEYTRGVYEARESAMSRVTAQAASIEASGVVGMRVEHIVRPGGQNGLIMGFDVIGTAIRQAEAKEPGAPETIVNLN